MAAGFVCPFKVTEDACNAANGCLWGTTDYDEEGAKPSCQVSMEVAMLMVNNKCQGSASDTLVKLAEAQGGNVTIEEMYEHYGVTDESSPSALAAAADAKVEAAAEATKAAEEKLDALVAASNSDEAADDAEDAEDKAAEGNAPPPSPLDAPPPSPLDAPPPSPLSSQSIS